MSRDRPPLLQLTPSPPTPPATPNKLQDHLISRSPSQSAWTPIEPGSVQFALPSAQTQRHKPTSSKTATSKTYHSQKTKAKPKKIPAKPYSASLNRLMVRYYALVQSLREPDLSESKFKSNVAEDKFPSRITGILAPCSSPVYAVSPVRDIQIQIQQRKTLQAIRNHVHASIFKPLTALAPVLTLPSLPSQEAEKEVRRVVKRAKRGMKVLEGLVTSMSRGLELELDLELDLDQKMGMEMDLD